MEGTLPLERCRLDSTGSVGRPHLTMALCIHTVRVGFVFWSPCVRFADPLRTCRKSAPVVTFESW